MHEKLPHKEIDAPEWVKRVLFADPKEFYERQYVNPKKRFNNVSLTILFPKIKEVCNCGCGRKLTGRQTRWATEECNTYAFYVFAIFSGRVEQIKFLLRKYHGTNCSCCGKEGIFEGLELEHTIPVHKGGGGCWLNNYTLMCNPCHKEKTKRDLARPKIKDPYRLELF